MALSDYTYVSLRMATAQDAHLPAYDYTKLTAINTCPVWGIIRYSKHKTTGNGSSTVRVTALEAGKVMHECFSAIRLYQLGVVQGMMEHAQVHGVRLFGEPRMGILRPVLEGSYVDIQAGARDFALETLSTAGYVDDPYDRRRTYANLETALLYYLQRWDFDRYPIWVRDAADPTCDVGIEIPFAVRVDYYRGRQATDRSGVLDGSSVPVLSFLYTGRIDGIHEAAPAGAGSVSSSGAQARSLCVGENKTASRLNDAWRLSFEVNHQPTGYCVAGSLFTGVPIDRALIWGTAIPLPRNLMEGYALENVTRPQHMKERWLDWMYHTVRMEQQHINNPLNAPRYTHSCNRYFRPCAFIPLCAADPEQQQYEYEHMSEERWDPRDEEKASNDT